MSSIYKRGKKWWGKFVDAKGNLCRVPLSVNKRVANILLAEHVSQAGRIAFEIDERTRRKFASIAIGSLSQALPSRNGFPSAPNSFGRFVEIASLVPMTPGIYFIWQYEQIVYVGKSICLSQRLTKSHPAIRENDHVSWISMSAREIDFSECFYIGIYRPSRNFNGSIGELRVS